MNKNLYEKSLGEEEYMIQSAIAGSSEAFEKLVINYKVHLYKVAYSYVKNKDTALEIIQETTYKAWMNINNLNDYKLFKAWITKILINTSLTYVKKQKKLLFIEDFIDSKNPLIYKAKDIQIEEKIDLYKAIDLLKPRYKTIILLRYFEDLKIEDIAYILDTSVNTVKTQHKRAKESLSNILKEDYLSEK